MKGNISTPAFIGIVVAVLAVIGIFIWKFAANSGTTTDAAPSVQVMNQGKPKTESLPADTDTSMMGGGGKGKGR
jgi:hypothetical protein